MPEKTGFALRNGFDHELPIMGVEEELSAFAIADEF